MYYNLLLFSVTRKSGRKKKHRWNLMSKEVDPDGSTSSSYFAMIKISPRREERYDRGEKREREGKSEDIVEGERQMQVQPAPVQDGRTDVRADEGGIEL